MNTLIRYTLFTALLLWLQVANAQTINYQVMLMKGKVSYKGSELKKGSQIQCADLLNASVLKNEMQHFGFSSNLDEVRLVNLSSKKIVLISAKARSEGRDLMLATRGIKQIKSDFEFRRAFNPAPAPLVLIAEDTVICSGLERFRFSGDTILIARFIYNDTLRESCIGANDTLFLTSNRLFQGIVQNAPKGFNTFESGEVQLFFKSRQTGEYHLVGEDFKPFSLLFLEDIIRYYASAETEEFRLSPEDIAAALVPYWLKIRQIQREYGFATEEEANSWLLEKIRNCCNYK